MKKARPRRALGGNSKPTSNYIFLTGFLVFFFLAISLIMMLFQYVDDVGADKFSRTAGERPAFLTSLSLRVTPPIDRHDFNEALLRRVDSFFKK